ncbi:RNI-like protein [Glarea lozoyensis ATCC 20868]|uniref:RNI-like protein n=1 Tax=Glarea lozoyensis (strain ATCC 20868 / MF5171) TaxID=1116229 RepID=S3D9B6_GLAL2|nr:RNI-like protein [Glarea lozoyensis ATCC 20868]EPE35082.1 RNI-like protein [Glarea lozoyensis ATCC 20868]
MANHASAPFFEIQAAPAQPETQEAQAITTTSTSTSTTTTTTTPSTDTARRRPSYTALRRFTSSSFTQTARTAVAGCPFGLDHDAQESTHHLVDCVAAASRPPPRPDLPPTRLSNPTTTSPPTDRASNTSDDTTSSPFRSVERDANIVPPSIPSRVPLPLRVFPSTQPSPWTQQPQQQRTAMRGPVPTMAPIGTQYRVAIEPEGDSQSSSSNSPARQDYDESDFYAGNNDSQSSIGVPTFRDMAVSGEVCEPPANRLPAEVLIGIFSKLSGPAELLNAMLVSKRWARNCVDLLWHRPSCTTWAKHSSICRTLSLTDPTFTYRDFVKRLNLASLADAVNDGSVVPLSVCSRIERLTLTMCQGLTDAGLIPLLTDSKGLLALDISGDTQITSESMVVLAEHCKRLQGLNITECLKISNESMIGVANACKHIKRLKLNHCEQLEDSAILAFARNCPNILEIDLMGCNSVGNAPVTELFANGACLRELRLPDCNLISDAAFLSLPLNRTYENLRIIDLTANLRVTDQAVERIIDAAPRLRNIIFAKCRNLTDISVNAISKLGKNLHYLHLGHCSHITDTAVIKMVTSCNRIRYIDLGCCTHLTDASITKLAQLPKLRRIGLVKCAQITDLSVLALAQYRGTRNHSLRPGEPMWHGSSLERVHLSYCVNLTLLSVVKLLDNCQKLTHLSLTGVSAFLRPDLEQYCREAPPEFTEHQRNVFCVFSGNGVTGLRRHLMNHPSGDDFDQETIVGDDQTMTGMMGATALTGDEDADADGDDDLDDVEVGNNSFLGAAT